jgi:hypothetical protein
MRLQKVKAETGRKMFSFQGALVFNELPEDLRQIYVLKGYGNKN